jgi:hypothetical protein
MNLVRENVSHEEWKKHHNYVHGAIGEKTDQVLKFLAEELRLSKNVVSG